MHQFVWFFCLKSALSSAVRCWSMTSISRIFLRKVVAKTSKSYREMICSSGLSPVIFRSWWQTRTAFVCQFVPFPPETRHARLFRISLKRMGQDSAKQQPVSSWTSRQLTFVESVNLRRWLQILFAYLDALALFRPFARVVAKGHYLDQMVFVLVGDGLYWFLVETDWFIWILQVSRTFQLAYFASAACSPTSHTRQSSQSCRSSSSCFCANCKHGNVERLMRRQSWLTGFSLLRVNNFALFLGRRLLSVLNDGARPDLCRQTLTLCKTTRPRTSDLEDRRNSRVEDLLSRLSLIFLCWKLVSFDSCIMTWMVKHRWGCWFYRFFQMSHSLLVYLWGDSGCQRTRQALQSSKNLRFASCLNFPLRNMFQKLRVCKIDSRPNVSLFVLNQHLVEKPAFEKWSFC